MDDWSSERSLITFCFNMYVTANTITSLDMSKITINSERIKVSTGVILGFVRLLCKLLRYRSSSITTVSQAPSVSSRDVKQSELHSQRTTVSTLQQLCWTQLVPVELFFRYNIVAFSWPESAGSFAFTNDNISYGLSPN